MCVRALCASLVACAALLLAPLTAFAAPPSSVAALGDSLTTAFGAGGAAQNYPEWSWATGNDPASDSHYLRLLSTGAPVDIGHVRNLAEDGATMHATAAQAAAAVSLQPQYVTVWAGTNDVCTATTAQMTDVAVFGQELQTTLAALRDGIPGVQVLVASIPDWYGFWQKWHDDAAVETAWATQAQGHCDDLLATGSSDRAAVGDRINALNQTAAEVCATFSECRYDGGAVYDLWTTLTASDLSYDFFHPALSGYRKVAAALWNSGFFGDSPQASLGYSAIGTDSHVDGANYVDVSGSWLLAQPASVSELRGYLEGGGSIGHVRAVIYADSAGSPGAAVATSEEISVPAGQPAAWTPLPLTTPLSLPAGRYWLGYWYADSAITFSFDNGIGSQRFSSDIAYSSTGSAPAGFPDSPALGTHDYSLYAPLGAAGTIQPPSNGSPPTITGGATAQAGQPLVADNGSWTGNPVGYAYDWLRCDASGAGCTSVGAHGQSYTPTAADVGSTLEVTVTAINGSGSGSATSARTAVVAAAAGSVPSGFSGVVTDDGCAGCLVSAVANGLRATIQGGADDLDTAYGLADFGGAGGRVYTRDVLALAQNQALAENLAVFQVRDTSDRLVYELYLDPSRTLRLWSPAGGLTAASINRSVGVTVPNDGSSSILVEVSALADDSVIVRVDGGERLTVTGLSGATTSGQRFIRAGVDHYDASTTNEPVTVRHTWVASSPDDWLGSPGSTATAPVNTGLPSIAGTAQVGGTLSASPGSWSGSPAPGFAYQWLRCASACVPIGGAVGQTYSPVGLDVGGTLEVVVTGSNSAGSSSATSAPTGSVSAGGGGDLAPDPDLEADPAGSYYTGGSAVFSWASDAAHSPTHALKIASGSGSLARWMSQASLLPVRAGSSYSVSAFLKLAAVGGSAFVTVGYYDAGGGFLGNGASSQALSGTRDWTQVGLQVTPPAGATLMRLEFRLYGPGTLWIDDITASSG